MNQRTTQADAAIGVNTCAVRAAQADTTATDNEDAARAKPAESVLYVNDERYRHLGDLLKDTRAHSAAGNAVVDDELQRVLFHEARLLDDRLYDDWIALFTSECLYWVPSRSDPGDPRTESGIYLDDRRRLLDRIAMIRTGHLHAQIPPSRTRRMLTNIEQWTGPDGRPRARANVVIWENRKAETRAYPGWQAYEMVRDASGALRLSTKIVCLLDCDSPQGNYSFIL